MSTREGETYLGDAVYASFDGYQIWLRTGDGNNQRIALEPQVYERLKQFVHDLSMRPRRDELEDTVDAEHGT